MPKDRPILLNPSFLIRGSKIKAKYKALLLLFKLPCFGEYFLNLVIPLLIPLIKTLSYIKY